MADTTSKAKPKRLSKGGRTQDRRRPQLAGSYSASIEGTQKRGLTLEYLQLRPKNCFSFPALMVLLSGAIILLAVVISLFTRRGRVSL
jgi:hypothetical protein